MKNIHLHEYVLSDLFLSDNKSLALPYDAIIYEGFGGTGDTDIPVIQLIQKPLQQDLRQFFSALSSYKHPLIILNELNIVNILPYLNNFSQKTILNLHSGLSSLGKKNQIENKDINDILEENLDIYEPCDLSKFQKILQLPTSKYIRISDFEIPVTIYNAEDLQIIDQNLVEKLDILPFTNYGFAGEEGTILCTGPLTSSALIACEELQNQNKHFDLFIMNKINFSPTQELKTSIQKTKNLILIIDHLPSQGYLSYIQSFFKTNPPKITFITPKYENITTILNEFISEQAKFDAQGIFEKLYNL